MSQAIAEVELKPRSKRVPDEGFLPKPSSFDLHKDRYSDEELLLFKGILIHDRRIAEQEIIFLKGLLPEDGHNEKQADWNEDPNAELEKKTTEGLIDRQYEFIKKIDAALERITNKTYGICIHTTKLINPDRLYAAPVATAGRVAKENSQLQSKYN